MPYFSIIVPLYNKESFVRDALNSILKQTYTDYEVIIVNDASTDDSAIVAETFLSEKIRIIQHDKNKGLAAARNTGIQNATSNFITYLDADDVWKPTFLEHIFSLTQEFSEAKIFATNYEEIWGTTLKIPVNGSENLDSNFKGYIDFFALNLKQGIYCHGSVCFHKSVFEKIGLYNEEIQFSEDLDFNIRANYHFKLAYSNSPQMIYFMQTSNQITNSSIKNKTIPNFDEYEVWAKNRPNLKRYLDFERYVLGKRLKKDYDSRWKKVISPIHKENLNWKQALLLRLPRFILLTIDSIKILLLKFNIKISTYN
ncbi:Glycosyl transferase, group 2 family protein [Flavobacterium indicum GPTSA100-9 = DSM 17447]|uniref:Glycosyl transferase, group 2 family protein n=1 Tax=Flavobacterium indicum (strain DSM 17447 / CIP 109464 / GPTSA100-9) TaxID=1094466 RepID=H8XU22_FLAIG|nr:glycosyltransferase family A protein [Flavobacterium indicum]CCG53752.1 Glycosyl transferase, group 2 family protein [Flavobacterium indicum GPTSA100-9 = DSM 17447]